MLFTWREITLLIITLIIYFLINYITICSCYIIFYFSKRFEKNLLNFINQKIKLINKNFKINENKNIYEFTKDLLIVTGCVVGIFVLILIYIIYMNSDLYIKIYNEMGKYIIFNIILFLIFNIPFYLYIIYHTSNYIKFDFSKILNN